MEPAPAERRPVRVEAPPFDREVYYVHADEKLDRGLYRPHLAGIGISGTIGAGMFLTSGAIIGISGSVGAPISYLIAGFIVGCVMYTLSEMVAARPITGALIDFPHQFVDPALGFAVCASYLLSNTCSMATLTSQTTELAANFKGIREPGDLEIGQKAGINVFLIVLTTVSHCVGVRFYGALERVIMWFKLSLVTLACVLMLIVNVGAVGKRDGLFHGNYTTHEFPPGWKPAGWKISSNATLSVSTNDANNFGIPASAGGILVAILNSVTMACFACMGGEQVVMTAGEARHPYRDLPAVITFVYLIPLSLYPIATFAVGANVNYTDPLLARPWASADKSLSPFMIAIRSSSINGAYYALNAFFMISAYTAGNTALYLASRSAFILAQNYLPLWFRRTVGKTNDGNTPLTAILVCSFLGLLSLVGLSNDKYGQPRLTLSALFTAITACIYIAECIAFLRYKAGLDRLQTLGIFSRKDPRYKRFLFRSRWQPLPAYIGIVGCTIVVIFSGFPALFILGAQPKDSSTLKDKTALLFDLVGAWFGPFLFGLFFLAYKYGYPKSTAVNVTDLTISKYVLQDPRVFELQDRGNAEDPNAGVAEKDGRAADAGDRERQQRFIDSALESRRQRRRRGFWRELWGFVALEQEDREEQRRYRRENRSMCCGGNVDDED